MNSLLNIQFVFMYTCLVKIETMQDLVFLWWNSTYKPCTYCFQIFNRINQCVESGQELRQADVNELKQELVAVFITTLQQNRSVNLTNQMINTPTVLQKVLILLQMEFLKNDFEWHQLFLFLEHIYVISVSFPNATNIYIL